MALTRFLFATSLLLFSLLILASAGDYSYSTNSEGEKPSSQDQSYTSKSYVPKLKKENHGYTHEQDVEKSKSKEKSKQEGYGYISKSNKVEHYKSKTVDHDYARNGYDSNSYVSKSKSEDNSYGYKSEDNGYGNNRKVDIYKSKSKSVNYNVYDSKPDYDNGYNGKSAPTGY